MQEATDDMMFYSKISLLWIMAVDQQFRSICETEDIKLREYRLGL